MSDLFEITAEYFDQLSGLTIQILATVLIKM